jgi:hypothetical protein
MNPTERQEIADRWVQARDADYVPGMEIIAGQDCGLIHDIVPAAEIVGPNRATGGRNLAALGPGERDRGDDILIFSAARLPDQMFHWKALVQSSS